MKHHCKASTAALTLATVALPAAAIAHTGEGAHVHGGLMAGLTHPVTGMDHLVALVLFGALLAGTTLKENNWALPLPALAWRPVSPAGLPSVATWPWKP